jgi:hypothetical protein
MAPVALAPATARFGSAKVIPYCSGKRAATEQKIAPVERAILGVGLLSTQIASQQLAGATAAGPYCARRWSNRQTMWQNCRVEDGERSRHIIVNGAVKSGDNEGNLLNTDNGKTYGA